MKHEIIEKLYDIIDEMTMLLVEHANLRYLDALAAAGNNIAQADVLQEVEIDIEVKLFALAKEVNEIEFEVEEVRKALQMALLKGMKADNIPLDEMTPDSMALIIAHLIAKLIPSMKNETIADFTVGTGNFLTAVLNALEDTPSKIFGVDSDYKLLELAKMSADMQDYNIQFFHQDSTRLMALPKIDIIIGDLPTTGVVDFVAKDSQLFQKGCKFLPYLLIENHIKYLSDDGFAIYIIGNDFFSQSNAAEFHKVLTDKVEIGMLLQLPESLFKDSNKQKSILVLKNSHPDVKKVKEVLVGNFPNFRNIEEFRTMLTKLENWVTMNSWAKK